RLHYRGRMAAGLACRKRSARRIDPRGMKAAFVLFILLSSLSQAQPPWRLSLPGWTFEFPRDHFAHQDFKTEWWYFTGNVRDESGRRFGYQLTFFRQGIRPPALRTPTT